MLQKPEFRLLLGAIGFITVLICGSLSGFSWYNPNATILTAIVTMSSGLLSAGLVKHFKKE